MYSGHVLANHPTTMGNKIVKVQKLEIEYAKEAIRTGNIEFEPSFMHNFIGYNYIVVERARDSDDNEKTCGGSIDECFIGDKWR